MTIYRIAYGHSGTQGQQWTTAREASRYAAETWGEVEATRPEQAVEIARNEGLDVGDWYDDPDDTIHVIPVQAGYKRAAVMLDDEHYTGRYIVEMPIDYDPEQVTGADIQSDGSMCIVGEDEMEG